MKFSVINHSYREDQKLQLQSNVGNLLLTCRFASEKFRIFSQKFRIHFKNSEHFLKNAEHCGRIIVIIKGKKSYIRI